MESLLYRELANLDALDRSPRALDDLHEPYRTLVNGIFHLAGAQRVVLTLVDETEQTDGETYVKTGDPGPEGISFPVTMEVWDRAPDLFVVTLAPGKPEPTPEQTESLRILVNRGAATVRFFETRRQVLRSQAEAASAIRARTHFLSNVSHELRTPLNGILGFSHLLQTSSLNPSQISMVQTIVESGQRLLGTVDNLLELTQIEAGLHVEHHPFSPKALLEATLSKHRPQAAEKGLTVERLVSQDVPSIVLGDPVLLGRAWHQILSNAIKFTAQGTIGVSLEVQSGDEGYKKLILEVIDEGIGFSSSRSGEDFLPFQQEDGSITRKFGGTGLGLALCHRIVQKMNGGLVLSGRPEGGTKAKVWVELEVEGKKS